jgi:uncharacterized protein YheU (UPF0270 family)
MKPGARPAEEPLELPLERIPPETLARMLEEFVTREWSELTDGESTLERKVEQVLEQLRDKRARIVYDRVSETWNIVPRQP